MSFFPEFKKFTLLLLITVMTASTFVLQTTLVSAMIADDSGESPPEQATIENMPIHVYMKHLIKNNAEEIYGDPDLQEHLLSIIYSSGTFLEDRDLLPFGTNFLKKAAKEDKYAWVILDYEPFFLNNEIINGISLRAQKGEAPALFNLSLLYEHGHGVEKDENKARELLIQASDKGFPRAQNHLGIKHYKSSDFNTAFDLFKKASDQGFVTAQHNLARCYYLANGCQEDLDLALKHWISAAMLNHSDSKHMLRKIISINENMASSLFKPYVCQNIFFDFEQMILNTPFYSRLKALSEDLLVIEKSLNAFNRPGFLITCMDFVDEDFKMNKNSKFIRHFQDYTCFGKDNVKDALNLIGALERLDDNEDIELILSLQHEPSEEDKEETEKFFCTLGKSQQKIKVLVEEVGTQIYMGERRRNRNFIDKYGDLFK